MKTFKNPISSAMSEYREDFRYNREWWVERMGTGTNNEYLLIMYKNGDCVVVQSDYFQLDGHTCLPRFRADEVAYISRYYGDQCETTTAADIVVDTDRIKLYADGVEVFRYEMSETEYKEMHRQIMELADDIDSAAWMLAYCRKLATSKMNNNNTPKTPDTMNTETAPVNVTTAIANELNTRNDKSAWDKAVTAYALELVEILDNWERQPASVSELREMMLNGADSWNAYSWGGSSLIYNCDIAERVCSPSELKRATRKDGSLRDMANAREYWLDTQARALSQAANRVANIAAKYFNA